MFNLKESKKKDKKDHKKDHKKRTLIKDRNIDWEETYTPRTKSMKERFEEEIGPGSYFRWEGYDNTTDNTYYVVVSPSYSKKEGNSFFAGIRKLPADFSPNGEYFDTLKEAIRYAKDTWDIKTPKNLINYTKKDLKGLDLK